MFMGFGNRGGFRREGGSRFGSRGRSFGGGRDRDGPREMTKVICSKCGKECEVPFKPTNDKPVFCSDCFKSQDGGSRGRGSSSGMTGEQFSQINAKLDKILLALSELEIVEDEEEEEEAEEAVVTGE